MCNSWKTNNNHTQTGSSSSNTRELAVLKCHHKPPAAWDMIISQSSNQHKINPSKATFKNNTSKIHFRLPQDALWR